MIFGDWIGVFWFGIFDVFARRVTGFDITVLAGCFVFIFWNCLIAYRNWVENERMTCYNRGGKL